MIKTKVVTHKMCIIFAGVFIMCVLIGISFKHYLKPQAIMEDIPIVKTMIIRENGALQTYTYSGEVRGRYESQLAFQVGGKIVRRHVEVGSSVKAGDVLMQIDSKDLQQVVNSGSAQVYSAESQLRLAEINLMRYKQLFEQGAVSRAQYDQYKTSYDVSIAAARQASAQYTQGANQLDYSQLYTDIPGLVSVINTEVGQVVSAGQPVVTVVRDGEREIEIYVPESRIDEINKAQKIKVKFWALPGVVNDGKIREIAPMADKIARTYKVRISLVNSIPEIKLGMTASVEIGAFAGQQPTTLYIPLAAIYQTGQSPAVWIVGDGVVELRPIRTGDFGDGKVQVLEGLKDGDVIVTAGIHKLKEGQKVNVAGGSL
ncbi:MAG: efflux transporter, family, subunit [Firmicutes bacterium]|nr:efflux transporter, family, subunit [Bacillota bacterium]